ncbi:hypothetical protein ROZALSC1DRAFT_30629, partial [Rozella allomycis CSF55]
ENPDTIEWLNSLVRSILFRFKTSSKLQNLLIEKMDEILNNERLSYLGRFVITNLEFGKSPPRIEKISECSRVPDKIGTLKETKNVDYEILFSVKDCANIGIETELILNWPQASSATLPISLFFKLNEVKGKAIINFANVGSQTFFEFCFSEEPFIDIGIGSLIGNKTKLKDVAKLSRLIRIKLRNVIKQKLTRPNVFRYQINVLSDLDYSDDGEIKSALVPIDVLNSSGDLRLRKDLTEEDI